MEELLFPLIHKKTKQNANTSYRNNTLCCYPGHTSDVSHGLSRVHCMRYFVLNKMYRHINTKVIIDLRGFRQFQLIREGAMVDRQGCRGMSINGSGI